MRPRLVLLAMGLVAANLAGWVWALAAFRHMPALVGTALLAWVLGLRHGLDADHIAAIDNVTRKLMQAGRRPLCTGLFFALGHASVVVLACLALAATASGLHGRLAAVRAVGGLVGPAVSALFLLTVAAMNIVVLAGVVRRWRATRQTSPMPLADAGAPSTGIGFLARLLRPVLGLISRSWHMYPLGVLFGLGFDTATEVGLLGISADQAAHGLSFRSALVMPALFTAGMALVDTADGMLMVGAYGWASQDARGTLAYNMAMTAISVAVAVLVGGAEAFGLLTAHGHSQGWLARGAASLVASFGLLGGAIVCVFALGWMAAWMIGRARRRQAALL